MQSKIILGLGFGDEGKGLVTAYHAAQKTASLVIRFSGGHQAGHTVCWGQQRHVFSSFGSGTLAGRPTFWSRYCTFDPVAFWRELRALQKLGVEPVFYLDALAPVTTPFDVQANRQSEKTNRHGSCGMGVGATYARMEGPHKLHAGDLREDQVVRWRLTSVKQYYEDRGVSLADAEELTQLFCHAVAEILPYVKIVSARQFFRTHSFTDYIFEGSQGILLDMDHGYFPHVTRTRTTSRQALDMIETYELPEPEVYYVTRAYQTRHGNGPLTNEHLPPNLHPTPKETNQTNEWQGPQRRSLLDLDQLQHALNIDANYCGNCTKHLVVTCLDQLSGKLNFTHHRQVFSVDSAVHLLPRLTTQFTSCLESYSPRSAALRTRSREEHCATI
ncbi:MAG: adenylosuccinate synthetase [Bacteroidota bacterium]